MTDQAQTQATPPVTPPPAVDPIKIAEQAAAAATEAAKAFVEEKTKDVAQKTREDIVRAISGEKPKDPAREFLEKFAEKPLDAFHGLKEITKKELREEFEQKEQHMNLQRSVAAPFISEYPQLQDSRKLAVVETFARQYEAAGKSHAEALELGFKDAVKELNLKSVSEAQRERGYGHGIPGGGGVNPGAPAFDDNKSQTDFLSGMRSRTSALRNRKAG